MGLQTWQPSEPPLSSMACLDVETPSICRGKFKSVLQLCLQQRRTREQLVDQGIMPPLKSPAAFHDQIRSLERARTGSFLKHKLCSRPERSELVRMHILQETQAEPSLQATQMKLKRARLADDLNEKIAHRPGPMELVEKNILPVDSGVKEVTDDKANNPKALDVYNFDEDSSDALSPDQPSSQESRSSSSASPKEPAGTDGTPTSSHLNAPMQQSPPNSQPPSDLVKLVSTTNEQQSNRQAPPPKPMTTLVPISTAGPILVKQSQPKTHSDKSRCKKTKEAKPRVKKLKYHQYIPPDQKQEPSEVPMDSAYARLLQQQQQFLQLQILSQQQQYNYQSILPAPLNNRSASEGQTSCSGRNAASNPHLVSLALPAPVRPSLIEPNHKPDHLPANLDEMKVAELKMELKLRSLPVSGTKTDLIERLKLYQENSSMSASSGAAQAERLTPPVSPVVSKVSSMDIEDSGVAESPAKLSETNKSSPQQEEAPSETRSSEKDSEKDKRLHEKERQIEELMRKLEQEQKLVEELKMQLEVEKRSQQGDSPPHLSPPASIQVKEENWTPSNCSASCSSPAVRQEEGADQSRFSPPHHFIISHQQLSQTLKQPETLHTVQAGAQILLPTSLSASAVTIQLPSNGIKLHTTANSAATGLIHTPGQVPQKTESSATLQQQCSTQTQPMTKAPCPSQPALILQQSEFSDHLSKCKAPPPYEDAVKQTRSMLTAVQGPTAASQHMDDLFEVLIESGEISPIIRQDPPTMDKPLPVTASVTTLPVNTALSRPPALVQMAQLPAAPLNPSTNLVALESLLDSTLEDDSEPQTVKLMEELNGHSSTDTMELDLNTPPSVLNLQNTNMDNMDWLDLTMSESGEAVSPLGVSSPMGVFSSVFLDSHELTMNWD